MNQKQQRKVDILTRLEAQALDVGTAAELLGVGSRQLRRVRARFRRDGFPAVLHGNAGRVSGNRIDPAVVERILALAGPGGKYEDMNVCHLQDLLDKPEKIKIGRSTLDRLLRKTGLRRKMGKSDRVHRRKRIRRTAEGMLLQMEYLWVSTMIALPFCVRPGSRHWRTS